MVGLSRRSLLRSAAGLLAVAAVDAGVLAGLGAPRAAALALSQRTSLRQVQLYLNGRLIGTVGDFAVRIGDAEVFVDLSSVIPANTAPDDLRLDLTVDARGVLYPFSFQCLVSRTYAV